MHHVHVRIVHEFAPVAVELGLHAEFLARGGIGGGQMVGVHVAERNQTAAGVAEEMRAGPAYSAEADHAVGELVAGRDLEFRPGVLAEGMRRIDRGRSSHCGRDAEEISSLHKCMY